MGGNQSGGIGAEGVGEVDLRSAELRHWLRHYLSRIIDYHVSLHQKKRWNDEGKVEQGLVA